MNARTRALACALALCLSTTALPACGGAGGTNGSDNATEAATTAVTNKTFVGDWSATKASYNGVTISGMLAAMDMGYSVNFADDGTITMSFGDSSVSGTWKLDGETAVATIAPEEGEDERRMPFTVEDEETLTALLETDEESITLTFAKGKDVQSTPEFDAADAKPITDSSVLKGTWKVGAVSAFGMCISGDFENLAKDAVPGIDTMTGYGITFNADGTGSFTQNGTTDDATWETTSSGTTITSSGLTFEIKMVKDDILIDLGEMLAGFTGSDSSLDMYLFLTKS